MRATRSGSYQAQRSAFPTVYPCKAQEVSASTPDQARVKLQFLQDNGAPKRWSEVVLRRDALKQEPDARAGHLHHLQWAFRGSAVGAETRFVRSAHYVPSGEPERATTVETRIKDKGKAEHADTPAAKRPPPRRQSNGHSGAPHSSPSGTEQASELLLEVDQLRSTVDQLPGEVSSLKGKIQSWDGTVARMASYQPGAGGARRGGSAPEESVGSGLGAH